MARSSKLSSKRPKVAVPTGSKLFSEVSDSGKAKLFEILIDYILHSISGRGNTCPMFEPLQLVRAFTSYYGKSSSYGISSINASLRLATSGVAKSLSCLCMTRFLRGLLFRFDCRRFKWRASSFNVNVFTTLQSLRTIGCY